MSFDILLRGISQDVPMNLTRNTCFEITLSKSLPHLPGIDELTTIAGYLYVLEHIKMFHFLTQAVQFLIFK